MTTIHEGSPGGTGEQSVVPEPGKVPPEYLAGITLRLFAGQPVHISFPELAKNPDAVQALAAWQLGLEGARVGTADPNLELERVIRKYFDIDELNPRQDGSFVAKAKPKELVELIPAQELLAEFERVQGDETEREALAEFLYLSSVEEGGPIPRDDITDTLNKLWDVDVRSVSLTLPEGNPGNIPSRLMNGIGDVPTDELKRTLEDLERRIKLNKDRPGAHPDIRKRDTALRKELENEAKKIRRELKEREKGKQRRLPGIDPEAFKMLERWGIPLGLGLAGLILAYLAMRRQQRSRGVA